MIFDYSAQRMFAQQLQLDDIGHFAIRCKALDGTECYMLMETVMGKTAMFTWGPMMPDAPMLVDKFNLTYKILKYKESIISKEITRFINDPQHKIYDIEVIGISEALTLMPTTEMYLESIR